jgi:hypothetical protein
MTDKRYLTADGVEITEGLAVWNYDLRLSTVRIAGTWADPENEFHKYWDGWFDMQSVTGERMSSMNGERMSTVHPFTGNKTVLP